MKALFIATLLLGFSLSANAAIIACAGKTEDVVVHLTANWIPNSQLTSLKFLASGNRTRDLASATLVPYHPRNPAYAGMNRFFLFGDGWSETSILLPQKAPTTSPFMAYYYDQGHSGTGTMPMQCWVLR